MNGHKKKTKKSKGRFSKLALYIMLSGWVSFAIYVFLFFFVLDTKGGDSFLQHFLSPDDDGIRFRALIFFAPFISTVIGFLVNEREKFFWGSMDSEARYHDLFENANDIIFVLGPGSAILEANHKASSLLGYSSEELRAKYLFDLIPPEDTGLLNHGREEERFVCKLRTSVGEWLDMELTSSAILEDEDVIGHRIIARDITDFKKMQEELSHAYDELQTCFVDKNMELTDAKKLLLFESYERNKAEETIAELLMRKKFGDHALPDLPDITNEDGD